MKVLFIVNVPSPYRVDFFNELGKLCELTVFFEKRTSDERNDSWKEYNFDSFRGVFLKGKSISTDTAICPEITKRLKSEKFDKIVIGNISSPTGMMAIQYLRHHKIPYYLEADGGTAKDGKGIKERLKRYFIRDAFGYFSTGKSCDEYFLAYGAKTERVIRYPFTSLWERDILSSPVGIQEKALLQKKLGIREQRVLLTVGQFIYRKGFDVLLNSVRGLPKDIGVYFVGGRPTKVYLKLVEDNRLCNVHFIGFKSKAELSEYYKAADVFVLPTREDIWGLVIQEAMAHGLPVISTTTCAAAQELVINGRNGCLIPPDDERLLAYAIKNVFASDLKSFAEESLQTVSAYTIEKMVACHLQVFGGMN